jgi:hypothetical protein
MINYGQRLDTIEDVIEFANNVERIMNSDLNSDAPFGLPAHALRRDAPHARRARVHGREVLRGNDVRRRR